MTQNHSHHRYCPSGTFNFYSIQINSFMNELNGYFLLLAQTICISKWKKGKRRNSTNDDWPCVTHDDDDDDDICHFCVYIAEEWRRKFFFDFWFLWFQNNQNICLLYIYLFIYSGILFSGIFDFFLLLSIGTICVCVRYVHFLLFRFDSAFLLVSYWFWCWILVVLFYWFEFSFQ